MESWEDCIASLQAGAPPEALLPRVRDLFSRLPPTNRVSPPAEDAQMTTPKDKLFFTMEDGKQFQMPYLRPPFFLFEEVKRAAGEGTDEQLRVDSEFDVDVLAEFGPQFINPPTKDVNDLIEKEHILPAHSVSPGEDAHRATKGSVMPVAEKYGANQTRRGRTGEDVKLFTKDLRLFLQTYKLNDDRNGQNISPLTFPPLTLKEWSLTFSGLAPDIRITAEHLTKFLLAVNQPSLAMFILQSMIPFFLASGPVSVEAQHIMSLLSFSATKAQLEKLPTTQIRALLDIYRGTDGGVLSALAQLSIITNSKQP